MNNVSLVGRLTKEPELKYTNDNKAILNETLAINRNFTNSKGERETDFINIVVFGKTAENVAKYMNKGSQIGVSGRIQTRSYENNEGKKVYVFEVISENITFLETKKVEKQEEEVEEELPKDIFKEFADENFKNFQASINDDDLPF